MASRGDKGNGNGEEQIVEVNRCGLHIWQLDWVDESSEWNDGCRRWRRCSAASSVWRSWWTHTSARTAPSCVAMPACDDGWLSSDRSARTVGQPCTYTSSSTAAGWRRSPSRLRPCSRATQLVRGKASGIGEYCIHFWHLIICLLSSCVMWYCVRM